MEGADGVLKVLVLGDPGTGKTSIIKRYVNDVFSTHYRSTIGVDFALKRIVVKDRTVGVQLWDIAGQDRFGSIARVYYKDALGAFIVFDLSRPETFETVKKVRVDVGSNPLPDTACDRQWKAEIDQKVDLPNGEALPCVLLANKCDLKADDEIDKAGLDAFARDHGFVAWFPTSAKENINIGGAAVTLVEDILSRDMFDLSTQEQERRDAVASAVALGREPMEGGTRATGGRPRKSGCC